MSDGERIEALEIEVKLIIDLLELIERRLPCAQK